MIRLIQALSTVESRSKSNAFCLLFPSTENQNFVFSNIDPFFWGHSYNLEIVSSHWLGTKAKLFGRGLCLFKSYIKHSQSCIGHWALWAVAAAKMTLLCHTILCVKQWMYLTATLKISNTECILLLPCAAMS